MGSWSRTASTSAGSRSARAATEGQTLATPLQMAEVAAAVANGGVLMEPTFLQQVTDPDGRTTEELDPDDEQTG